MGTVRTKFVREMANSVLAECGITEPPVDLKRIMEVKGYVYMEVDTFPNDVSAFFIAKDGKNYALVNAKHHPNRRRFSLAHELGHIILRHNVADLEEVSTIDTPPEIGTDSVPKDAREKEANMFANALLMPLEMLKKEYAKGADIGKLANIFAVSQQAITIAVMNNLSALMK